jgi:putative ABC transport system permease protein
VKFLPLILKNLLRKKTRSLLTIGSIAVALFLFGLLIAIETGLNQGAGVAGADRLVVRNRISLIMFLPLSYQERIRQMPHVEEVTFSVWFGGVYQDRNNFFPQFAIDPETYKAIYSEVVIPDDDWQAFLKDREGAVVGRGIADRFGWKVGDRIPLQGTIFPGTWEFNIRAIYDGSRQQDDTSQFWLHWKYLEERMRQTVEGMIDGMVGWYVIQIDDPDNAVEVARAVDQRFANSPYETSTETESAFAAGFAKQIGNIRLIILSIGAVVMFTLLLVTGNTMAMAVRERTSELGVLKSLGFTDAAVLLLVLSESVILAVVGGSIGLGLFKLFTLGGDPTGGMMPIFYIGPDSLALGAAIAAVVGLAAGAVPSLTAMRLRIVDALRRV